MPSSTACRNSGSAASSPSDHWSLRRSDKPKLMHPSAIRLTFRPELPRRVYSMPPTYSSPGEVAEHGVMIGRVHVPGGVHGSRSGFLRVGLAVRAPPGLAVVRAG